MTRSLTAFVNPDAKTSWPRSRSEKVRSSTISGGSSISRTRAKLLLTCRRTGAGQPLLLAFRRLQIHHPDASAGGVVGTVIVLDHCAPRLQRAHGEGHAFEIVARVIQYFIGVPVVGQNRVAGVDAQHGVVAVVGRFRAHIARGAALLAFGNDVTFLPLGFDLGLGLDRIKGSAGLGVHTVSATAAASVAAAMLVRFFASAA